MTRNSSPAYAVSRLPCTITKGESVCAISVSGLPLRIPMERIPVLGRLVAETARELTIALGGAMPG